MFAVGWWEWRGVVVWIVVNGDDVELVARCKRQSDN